MKSIKHKVESLFLNPKGLTFNGFYRHIKSLASMSTFRLNATYRIQDFFKNKYDPHKTQN